MMSCPDWPTLSARRDVDPEAWDAALAHLDGCPTCRKLALDFEPTLLFRRLPRLAPEADTVAAMKQAVSSMRRVEHLEPSAHRSAVWLRGAAAAAVLVIALLLRGAVAPEPEPSVASSAISLEQPAAPVLPAEAVFQSAVPLVEDLRSSSGQMIQLVSREMDLVLVLNEEIEDQGFEDQGFEDQGFDV